MMQPSVAHTSRQPAGARPGLGPPVPDLLGALGWYCREVLQLERLLNAVTVKRRRNLARPVARRRSAFRDPLMCIDFLAMWWLGVERLSEIAGRLRPRDDLARAVGLRRFCDHTTAHNFLNAFHRTHVRQLDRVNARLLREHGAAAGRAPILDVDVAERAARRAARRAGARRGTVYRWALALCAGEAVAQSLAHRRPPWRQMVVDLLDQTRDELAARPRLVRLSGECASLDLFRALRRRRLTWLAVVPWSWTLAHRPAPGGEPRWAELAADRRLLDLGVARARAAPSLPMRTVLVEEPAPAPGAARRRWAVVASMLDEPPGALVRLAASSATIPGLFGRARWPLADGKLPSSDPRGNAAYLRLGALAMNVLRLFARHLGDPWSLARVCAELRALPDPLAPPP